MYALLPGAIIQHFIFFCLEENLLQLYCIGLNGMAMFSLTNSLCIFQLSPLYIFKRLFFYIFISICVYLLCIFSWNCFSLVCSLLVTVWMLFSAPQSPFSYLKTLFSSVSFFLHVCTVYMLFIDFSILIVQSYKSLNSSAKMIKKREESSVVYKNCHRTCAVTKMPPGVFMSVYTHCR